MRIVIATITMRKVDRKNNDNNHNIMIMTQNFPSVMLSVCGTSNESPGWLVLGVTLML